MSGAAYEEALDRLSSLIVGRTRADASFLLKEFDLLFDYLKMLDLEDAMSKLKVIHVAGTKGKGSTCAFTESILRSCGLHTGLFMSPHLIDIRERFKIDGMDISEEKFLAYFWWCWYRLEERTDDNIPMPIYVRFLALLAFKIFVEEKVDVAILEVGLGGKFDATNVVRAPVVCGVSSLGYDHTEILGNTQGQIAGEKAGIFKEGVAAYTVPQPEEAMNVLEQKASELGIPLVVVPPLDVGMLKGLKLGLAGEHQYVNAGLAVALCHAWLKNLGHAQGMNLDEIVQLPEEFIKGLASTSLPGRAQVVPDPNVILHGQDNCRGGLIFYLDGAHSPESMEVCGRWFSHVIRKEDRELDTVKEKTYCCKQILIFNCMPVRDPRLLFPRLVHACAECGVHFHKALFVPNQSVFNKVVSHATPLKDPPQADVSWQHTLQRVWEDLKNGDKGYGDAETDSSLGEIKASDLSIAESQDSSSVIPSLTLAVESLRKTAEENPSVRFQVLVTGSLHLVGDVTRLLRN